MYIYSQIFGFIPIEKSDNAELPVVTTDRALSSKKTIAIHAMLFMKKLMQ